LHSGAAFTERLLFHHFAVFVARSIVSIGSANGSPKRLERTAGNMPSEGARHLDLGFALS
jgi:hypothetical protein